MTDRYRVNLLCPYCHLPINSYVSVMEDPGVRTFANGDPGYPGTVEVEFNDGFPENETCPWCKHVWNDDELVDLQQQAVDLKPADPDPFDEHRATAAQLFQVAYDDVTEDMRQDAKLLRLARAYGGAIPESVRHLL